MQNATALVMNVAEWGFSEVRMRGKGQPMRGLYGNARDYTELSTGGTESRLRSALCRECGRATVLGGS